jgi:hypothetical protein
MTMAKTDKAHVLKRDKEYVKFVQLLRKAEREGRLDGDFICRLCGMKFHSVEDAAACCKVTVA